MTGCALEFEDHLLAALYGYNVLDTPPEESFDRITRLVRVAVGVPIATVPLVDQDRQFFKSRQGTDSGQMSRDISFYTHTIQNDEPLIVLNALDDPRFRNSPLVTCDGGMRFYVGVPLKTPDGFNLGALCAIDTKPGTVSEEQLNLLRDLARLVVDELELHRLATVDNLTGAMTCRGFTNSAAKEVARAVRNRRDLSVIVMDLDHFKKINDTYGHAAGDEVLRHVVATIAGELRAGDLLGRLGDEEFAVLLPETALDNAMEIAEDLRHRIASVVLEFDGDEIPVTASLGVTNYGATDGDFANTLNRADSALYQAKVLGRNGTVATPAEVSGTLAGAAA